MLCSFCILVMLQIRFLSNLILAKSTFLQKEDTTYCLQPYFVQLPLTTFLLFQKIHLPQKVANRVFTQSLHFAYSAAFIPVQNLLIPAPFRSFVHTLFAYTRKLARGHSASGTGSNASTVSPVAACICFAVALRFVGCLFPQAGIFIRVHFLPSANIVF